MLCLKKRGGWAVVFSLAIILSSSANRLWAGPMSGYVGHTSPHSRDLPSENFSHPDKEGNIRPVSILPDERPTAPALLSGTVYYMVFERDDRDPNDPWGTGIPNFMKSFRAGIDFNGGSSPDLDARSKYLYLYQVVNHQRTIPPVESMSTKLLVELSEITSWGYFHGLGFALKDENGVVRPLSATNKVDAKTFLSPAPALAISQPLTLASVPSSRGEAEPIRDANKGRIVQVHWDALDPATPPDYVMILGSSDFGKLPSFRAIWSGKNAIGKDGRSTAFGFTSPLPPTIEPVRLRTSREAAKEAAVANADDQGKQDVAMAGANKTEGVKLARLAEEEANGTGTSIPGIEGRVPTPYPTSPGLAFNPDKGNASSGSGAGWPLANSPAPAPAASGGGFGGGGFGGVSTVSNPGSGGGSFGGGGFISGGGTNTIVQTVRTSSPATATSSVVNNINFNVSQSNQQSQKQFQYQNQKQSQGQSQSGGGGGHGAVVPEPATIIGLTLGLPALFAVYRRRTRAHRPMPSA